MSARASQPASLGEDILGRSVEVALRHGGDGGRARVRDGGVDVWGAEVEGDGVAGACRQQPVDNGCPEGGSEPDHGACASSVGEKEARVGERDGSWEGVQE